VLPSATERILRELPDDAQVLDIGGWAAPFNRANWIIDFQPWDTRGAMGSYGPAEEWFTPATWVIHDICDRDPWPFADKQFDFALCVTTLEDVRDPIGVCREMSRVAKRGYVEVPTIEAELIYNVEGTGPYLGHEHHRWFCDYVDGEMEFLHKPHNIHHDWTLRVIPRWRERMTMEDHLLGVFWEGELRAHERIVVHEWPLDELRARVRAKFEPSRTELAIKQARDVAVHGVNVAKRPLKDAAGRLRGRMR